MNRLSSGVSFIFIIHVTSNKVSGGIKYFQIKLLFFSNLFWLSFNILSPIFLKSFKMKKKCFHNATTNKAVAGCMHLESNTVHGPPVVHADTESCITGQDGVWGGFVSSNQILSPCGIPLIFSSAQIRLCFSYWVLLLSFCLSVKFVTFNLALFFIFLHAVSSRWLMWGFFGDRVRPHHTRTWHHRLFDFAGAKTVPFLISVDYHASTPMTSLLCAELSCDVNRLGSSEPTTFLCLVSVPTPSPRLPPSLRPSKDVLLADKQWQPSDQQLWWSVRPRAGHWTRPDLCFCLSLAFVMAA